MTRWENVFNTGNTGVNAIKLFADGELSIESVQKVFRNTHPDASREVRSVIRTRGAKEARRLARKALRRRGLV